MDMCGCSGCMQAVLWSQVDLRSYLEKKRRLNKPFIGNRLVRTREILAFYTVFSVKDRNIAFSLTFYAFPQIKLNLITLTANQ
jgi:hypothetical protein